MIQYSEVRIRSKEGICYSEYMIAFIKNIYSYIKELNHIHLDRSIIYIFPIAASILAGVKDLGYFPTILLFYGLPSLYLSIRYPRHILKVTLFSLVLGVLLTIPLDYIAHASGAWLMPVGSYRILKYVSVEDISWGFLLVYLILIHYESLVHKHFADNPIHKRMQYLLEIMIVTIGLFLLLFITNIGALNIDYFYFKAGTALVLTPIILITIRSTRVLASFAQTAVFFSLVTLLHEIVALEYGHWFFPQYGEFVGFVQFAGHTIPFEEILFWIILMGFGILSYFQYFDED